jgi:pimeloyl-[acyl-carrier protein] methyl ester esterase
MKRVLRLGDGDHLAYTDVGTGRPLLLLHGWAMRGDLFASQAHGLAAHFRVIAPDLRGHGDSSKLRAGQDLTTLGGDLEMLVRHLELDGAILCGWSMGAMVAWDHLVRHGGAGIAGLVVVDMAPLITNEPGWDLGLRDGRTAAEAARMTAGMRSDWDRFCRGFVPRIFAGEAPEPASSAQALSAAQVADVESMVQLWSSMIRTDFREALQAIDLPTLIVTGARSQLYAAATGEWLEAHMRRASRAVLEQSGHAPHLEEPERFNQLIQQFSERLAPVKAELQPKSDMQREHEGEMQ